MYKSKKLFSKQKQAITVIPIADIHAILSSDKKVKHLDFKRNNNDWKIIGKQINRRGENDILAWRQRIMK